jgi:hypothetical protein
VALGACHQPFDVVVDQSFLGLQRLNVGGWNQQHPQAQYHAFLGTPTFEPICCRVHALGFCINWSLYIVARQFGPQEGRD